MTTPKNSWNTDVPDAVQIDKEFKINQEYDDIENNEPTTWYFDFKMLVSIFKWFKRKKKDN